MVRGADLRRTGSVAAQTRLETKMQSIAQQPLAAEAPAAAPADPVCGFMLATNRLKPADLKRAEAYRDQNGGDLVTLLVRLGLVSERDVAEAESQLLELPLVRSTEFPETAPEFPGISVRFLKQNLLLPVAETESELTVVMANPRDEFSARTRWHWLTATKSGIAVGGSAILGLLVGAVVTSQTLYAATAASLIFPFAPHTGSDVYDMLTGDRVWEQPWPAADLALLERDTVEVVLQVNGKLRDRIQAPADASREALEALAREQPRIQAHLNGNEVVKVIVVPAKLVNFVVR